jgi:hypothetical protein
MKIMYDDARCYQNIINAVIARAMMDTFKVPMKDKGLDQDTFSAFEFLFGDDVDPWLELIDIDPVTFKRRLKDAMWDAKIKIGEADKRCFRENYKRWYTRKNEAKLLGLGYRRFGK